MPELEGFERGRKYPLALPDGFPAHITERFIAGTLAENVPVIEETLATRTYRIHEQKVELPGGRKALLRVDYMKHRSPRDSFDYINFDLVEEVPGKDGEHPTIAAMDWYISNRRDRLHYDFALGHRYVRPPDRNLGVGTYLYGISEAWIRQVAEKKGKEQTLCIVTRQKRIMDYAEGLGYAPYGEDIPLRKEVLEHPERFIEKEDEIDEDQPGREPFLYRKDTPEDEREPWNAEEVWYRKIISPEPTHE